MPAIGGRQPYSTSLRDYDGELKSFVLFTGEITAVSIAGLLTQLGTFQTALDAVVLGQRAREQWGEETIVSNARATDKDAQVSTEMLVRCIGATSEAPYSFRIPTIDPEAFNYVEGNVVLSGAGATAATTALVAAIEAAFKMPDDETEAIEVVQMRIVD
jgi:hypothetical protein